MHDLTYGITSDPLTQFACTFSALVHDVDHPGVPNSQLVKENSTMANFYKGKSVAEQNSVQLAYDLLLDDNFKNFRSTLTTTSEEQQQFRQLVVNCVMATDVMDKDLTQLRNQKWEIAFNSAQADDKELPNKATNRKATIVIEHLLQASDVCHTMQVGVDPNSEFVSADKIFSLCPLALAYLPKVESKAVSRVLQGLQGREDQGQPR